MHFYTHFRGFRVWPSNRLTKLSEIIQFICRRPLVNLPNWCFVLYYAISKAFCHASSLGHFIYACMWLYITEELLLRYTRLSFPSSWHTNSPTVAPILCKHGVHPISQISSGPASSISSNLLALAVGMYQVNVRELLACMLYYDRKRGQYIMKVTRTCLVSGLEPPFQADVCANSICFSSPY